MYSHQKRVLRIDILSFKPANMYSMLLFFLYLIHFITHNYTRFCNKTYCFSLKNACRKNFLNKILTQDIVFTCEETSDQLSFCLIKKTEIID